MTTEIILLLTSTLLTSVLGIMLAIVAFNYRKIVSRYESIRVKEEKNIEEAMTASREILDQAQNQASTLITRTETILGEIEKQFTVELENMRGTTQKGFEQMLVSAQEQTRQAIVDIGEAAGKDLQKGTAELLQNLSNHFKKSQEDLNQKIEGEMQQTVSLISQYQKQVYEQIDSAAWEIASRVAQDLLRRNLDIKDQEELVVESLENAKKEKLL